LFSNRPDPSLHGDRLKRRGITGDYAIYRITDPERRGAAIGRLDAKNLAREYGLLALWTLISIALDPTIPATSRVKAVESILDRAYGRPITPMINISR
jgi:hypothetical protein